jgi:hypothetical protein
LPGAQVELNNSHLCKRCGVVGNNRTVKRVPPVRGQDMALPVGREGLAGSTFSFSAQEWKMSLSISADYITGPGVNKSPAGFYGEGNILQGRQLNQSVISNFQ